MTARFTPYLRGRRMSFAAAILASLGYSVTRLLEPWPLKLIIDHVLLDEPLDRFPASLVATRDLSPTSLLYVLTSAILFLAVLRGLFYLRQRVLIAKIGNGVVGDLRLDLYKRLHGFSLSFHNRRQTGDILVRLILTGINQNP